MFWLVEVEWTALSGVLVVPDGDRKSSTMMIAAEAGPA
jgi:hypothetical protein